MFAVSDHRHTYHALVIYHVLHLQRKERRGECGGGVVGRRGDPSEPVGATLNCRVRAERKGMILLLLVQ